MEAIYCSTFLQGQLIHSSENESEKMSFFFFKNIITLPSKGDGNDLITICLLPECFWILNSDLSHLVCLPFSFSGL